MTQHPSRRDVVIGGAAATFAAGTARAATPPTEAAGTVSEVDGSPLVDVLVSNGREVVRSDGEGRWRIGVAPGQTIFAIKPAGFGAPLDPETNLSKLFYVHDPDGTPGSLDFRYRGLKPTGHLPASIDFTLTREAELERFDVILFTDPQPESAAEIEYVRDDAVAPLLRTDAAFGMTLGDLAFDNLTIYARLNRMVGRIGVP